MATALSTSRPRLNTANRHVRRKMLTKNKAAQISATIVRITFAGINALTSVYPAPVNNELGVMTSSYRSSQ